MSYTMLSPKYILYLGVCVNTASLIFLGFVYKEALLAHEIVAAIILGILSGIAVIWWIFFMNKFIHAKIDLANNMFVYGNLFFTRMINMNQVKLVGKFLYFSGIVKVQVGEKKYYVNSINENIKQYLT